MPPITVVLDKSKGSLGATFDTDAGCIIISRIQKGGWLDGTDLSEGHEVISVNGEPCGGLSVGEVEQLFASASGSVTVIADNPMDTQRRRAIKL
mmetsp:Transcript_12350/g.15650  ORF Transcript_12350/g.15650 Transcript_12350/m.15650 type:complete len:94 (-) Transcript_12350:167-448(-)|eukprot:CAMPEP_0203634924 /NCGR_PEP_ID=MMETSP0088-20131115/1778_1 /ASSEMBLY_ACC=CAM_ASM_001087 /TAXON_ID=426623 /ORGANISM="Chaetoceros affinis, Strain CCMP159" /LENGTH=93 /DNA_ID=CAMNT_0050488633 /DNA_START=147 /DNA_END=428 /DNA_ORIENTATION=+